MRTAPTDPGRDGNRLGDYLFVLLQYLLPHHLLSWLMYLITRSEWQPLKDRMIRTVIRLYDVDMFHRKLELYRRLAAPYEDLKIEEAGDVYTADKR